MWDWYRYMWFDLEARRMKVQEAHTEYVMKEKEYEEDRKKGRPLDSNDKELWERGPGPDYVPGGATKYDTGKPRVMLVLGGFAHALELVSKVGTMGAQKYSPDGWKYVPNAIARYWDAFGRHLLEIFKGNWNDEESELPHLAHIAWNALAILEYKHGNIQGRSDTDTA